MFIHLNSRESPRPTSNFSVFNRAFFYRVAFGPLRGSETTGLRWLVKKYINNGCSTAINSRRYILLLLALAIPSGADSGTIINRKVRTYKESLTKTISIRKYGQLFLRRAPLGPVLERRPSYKESNKRSKERQGPTLGVRLLEGSVKRESTVCPN